MLVIRTRDMWRCYLADGSLCRFVSARGKSPGYERCWKLVERR